MYIHTYTYLLPHLVTQSELEGHILFHPNKEIDTHLCVLHNYIMFFILTGNDLIVQITAFFSGAYFAVPVVH